MVYPITSVNVIGKVKTIRTDTKYSVLYLMITTVQPVFYKSILENEIIEHMHGDYHKNVDAKTKLVPSDLYFYQR